MKKMFKLKLIFNYSMPLLRIVHDHHWYIFTPRGLYITHLTIDFYRPRNARGRGTQRRHIHRRP